MSSTTHLLSTNGSKELLTVIRELAAQPAGEKWML
jgi:hypothetical protein